MRLQTRSETLRKTDWARGTSYYLAFEWSFSFIKMGCAGERFLAEFDMAIQWMMDAPEKENSL